MHMILKLPGKPRIIAGDTGDGFPDAGYLDT